jgi:membrane protein YfhO
VDRDRPVVQWVWVIVAVTVCLSIGLPLLGIRVLYPSDIVTLFHPWKDQTPPGYRVANDLLADPIETAMPMHAEFGRRLREGDFPLWASEPTGGVPLGPVPYWSLLSPLNLPYLALPLWYAPAITTLLEVVIAILFTYLFARRIGLGKVPSIVGGLIYAFSGFQVVWSFWPQSHIGALIPALFWAAERALQEDRLRSTLPVAVVVAVMMLEGFPAVLLFAVIGAGAYVMLRVFTSGNWGGLRRVRSLASFGGAVVLGLGISGLQLLPFIDGLKSMNLAYRAQTPDSHLPLRALVTLFVPNAFGSPVDLNYFGRRHYHPTGFVRSGYVEQQSFIGATALILVAMVVIALWRRPGSNPVPRGVKTYLWIGLGLMVMLIYVGGPVLGLLQKIPPFGTNYIGRLRAVMGFFLACLAALGLHALLQGRGQSRTQAGWFVAMAVGGLGVLLAAFGLWRTLDLAREVQQRRYVVHQAVLPLAAAGVAVAAILLNTRRWWAERRLVAVVIPALVAAEALAFVIPFWPRVPKWTFYPTTPAHRYLEAHLGHDRLASQGRVLYPGTTTFYGLRSVTAHAFAQRTWTDLLTELDPRALSHPTFPLIRGKGPLITSPILDRLSARYFVDAPEAPVLGSRVEAPRVTGTVKLLPGTPLSANVPDGMIRAVGIRVVRVEAWLGSAELIAQVLDRFGAVRSTGVVHLKSVRRQELTIPVVERPPTGAGSVEVRLVLRARGGRLVLAAAGPGTPAASVVMAHDDGLRLVFSNGATIYQRLNALPRIRWAARATVIPDARKRIFALAQGVPPDIVVLSGAGPPGSERTARLRVLQDGDDEIRVSVDASGQGYLVVADAIQHGWVARIDGRPVAMHAADHAGMAVLVPPGRHQVVLRYEPPGWRPGLVVSGISLIVLLALVVLLPRRAEGTRW